MLMRSKLHGVRVSAKEAVPPPPPPMALSSTSAGIRAPLTNDDSDFEYSASTNYEKDCVFSSNDSDSELESDGLLSGDEFETVSERPPFADPDDKILEETHFVKEYIISRPSVKIPREEIYDEGEGSGDRDFEDSSPFSDYLDEQIVGENAVVEDYNDPRPFLADKCEEPVGTSMEEDENGTLVRLPVFHSGIAFANRQGIPIAKLSGDSDDDFESNESVEDAPFLGVVRVPSPGDVESLGSAPKVRVLEVGEEDDSVLLSDCGSEAESLEDSIVVDGDNGFSDSCIQEKQTADDLISAEVIEDKGPSIVEEAQGAESYYEIQEFNMNTRENSVCNNANNPNPTDSTVEETEVINILGNNGVKEGQVLYCEVPVVELTEAKVKDNFGEAPMDYGSCVDKNVDENGTAVHCELDASEDLANEIEHKIDQQLDGHNHDSPEDFESMDSSSRECEVQSMNNVKLPELAVAQEQGCLMFGCTVDVTSGESSQTHLECIDAEIVTDSCDELDAHSHSKDKEIFNSFSQEELLRVATGVPAESSSVMLTSSDLTIQLPQEQPVGLNSRILALRPTAPALLTQGPMNNGESVGILSQEEKMKLEKLEEIGVKFFRLVHRLNRSSEDSVVTNVLYQLQLAAGRPSAQAFNFDFAKQAALVLEAEGKNDLNFSLNILVIGKSGVGKSATINSIFGEQKARTDAFEPGTTSVKEIIGTLDGVQIRVLDTPGLRSSLTEQSFNYKILSSIKKSTKAFPPDVVLYVDRLDTQTRDLNDLPLLKSVTSSLGSSIWYSAIVTLSHAASTPPEGSSGYPLSYDLFVAKRSHFVQQLISHSVGNFHIIKPGLLPVSLIENSSMSGMEKKESWRSQLLLLCYSMKILSEIDSLVKTNRALDYRKLFGFKVPSPSLPYFMSPLLQSSPHSKLSTMLGSENVDSDIELAYSSDYDQESDDEHGLLPPFKPLKKSETAKLSKEQGNAYLEEYDNRVKLLQKKQWVEEVKMFRDAKKKQKEGTKDDGYMEEDNDTEMDSSEAVAAPLPELPLMVLPHAFDGHNPCYRYRSLESSMQFLALPVLNLHGWDHDGGYDGLNMEDNLANAGSFPAVIAVQLKRDKNEFKIHLNSSVSIKHRDKRSMMSVRAGFNSKQSGVVSIRISSSDQPLIATIGLLHIAKNIFMQLSQRWQEQ